MVRFIGDGLPWDDERIDARVNQALERATVDSEGAARWFIASEPQTGKSGRVGLVVAWLTPDGVEVGYWVHPSAWGRGIARAMVSQALPLISELYGPERSLCAQVDPANLASVRVLLGCGFERSGSVDGREVYALSPRGSA
ncbi:RimJ/RimL family protein N-acetyltransferase [Arthrobacter pigmenti]|uniref:RimJ/RimL family protein N-acetyltransferase n=1 Tax=Arthrobacter pigmenti TaxID=271432 RepID=A0A846RRT2_9MICC|nr:RimJ/RimL family protein N-acetyltransferase [Arthrobacter pigmenti]